MSQTNEGRLKGRLAVITGASRGIGRSVALAFAREGAHVIAIARTVGGLEEVDDLIQAEGGSATLVPLDLTDFDALDRLGASIHERWGKLDILVGNAGLLGDVTPLSHLVPSVWQKTLDVNVTANYRLIRSLDPLLRQSDAGRVILVTSGAATHIRPFLGAYAITKAALDAMGKTYAAEVDGTSVKCNLLSPGPIRTAMRATFMPGEDPQTLPHPDEVAGLFVELALPACDKNGEIVRFERKN
ncbi:MAG: SDR family NAD(P)-dependent oxidoreductase [Alphaproteobacteria bacterium]|nr:MAG: SDR family NAD(P)-dependent oxidoreductase [Alphaproteobacteria bacterium]